MIKIKDYNLRNTLLHFLTDTIEYMENAYDMDRENTELHKNLKMLVKSRESIYEVYKVIELDISSIASYSLHESLWAFKTDDPVYVSTREVIISQLRKELITVINIIDIILDVTNKIIDAFVDRNKHHIEPSKILLSKKLETLTADNRKNQRQLLQLTKRNIVDPQIPVEVTINRVILTMMSIGKCYEAKTNMLNELKKKGYK